MVATDHKPLLGVFEKDIGDVDNPRLRALMEKTLQFHFEVVHLPGVINLGADATSRNPVGEPEQGEVSEIQITGKSFLMHSYANLSGEEIRDSEELENRVVEIATMMGRQQVSQVGGTNFQSELIDWSDLAGATQQCEELSLVVDALSGKSTCGDDIGRYKPVMSDLVLVNDVVMYKGCVVIPKSLRKKVLEILHMGHAGVTGMKLRANGSIWWPGVGGDIERKREECWTCKINAPSQPAEPPLELPKPEYPMQMLAADYFELGGYNYLVIVDRYSNWPAVFRIKVKEGADELCRLLRRHFATFGCPDELATDGGSQ